MDETFFAVSFMAVSSEIFKTNNKNKFLFNYFLLKNLLFFHYCDSMRFIQNSCYYLEIYICPIIQKKSLNYLTNRRIKIDSYSIIKCCWWHAE